MFDRKKVEEILIKKASMYVQCQSEGGKLECDYATIRTIHSNLTSEDDRQLYKERYELYKQQMRDENKKM